MKYPDSVLNAAGCLIVAGAISWSGLDWLAGPAQAQAPPARMAVAAPVAQAPAGPPAATMPDGSTATMILGLATLIVAPFFAWLNRRTDAATAAKIAGLEASNATLHDMFNRLVSKLETAAKAIDVTTSAVVKVADAASVTVAVAPKMNGGHGAMDTAPH